MGRAYRSGTEGRSTGYAFARSPFPTPDSRLMSDHHARFLQLALHAQALRFGQFTLKSGRQSPYFFNAGRFDSGTLLAGLAACYADAIEEAGLQFDLGAVARPQRVEVAGEVYTLVGVSTEEVTLTLNNRSRKTLSTQTVVVGQRGSECGDGVTSQ